ncbi:MAG TPA: NADH-quinone oxidoreductase subunit A [Bacteroidota bacterium]|nr:NADH-quinone oxidoreductase subunit A [Bacteroidota bacterium]
MGQFFVYIIAAIAIVASMLAGSWVLGQRHSEPATGEVYESGIEVTGSTKLRLYPRFYLVAMFFVVFDLESVYLFAWAASARELGWPGYFEVLFFVSMLIVALIYLWRVGGLNFGPVMRHRMTAGDDSSHRQPLVTTERNGVNQ